MIYFFPSVGRVNLVIVVSLAAASPNVVHITLLSTVPLQARQIFLSASIISGIVYCVRIPNPTVSARVKTLLPTPTTTPLENDVLYFHAEVEPNLVVLDNTGMVIQISVIGLAPGLVQRSSLHDTHQGAPTTSHSSPAWSTQLPH